MTVPRTRSAITKQPLNILENSEHRCEVRGCMTIIPIGLALRFCEPCRLQQPIPQYNSPRWGFKLNQRTQGANRGQT